MHRPPRPDRHDPRETAMPRALIADDERLMREQLRARLAEVWPELEIVAEARHGAEAVALVAQHRPDLVFLDIRMPGMTGVEAAREIAQLRTDEAADGEQVAGEWAGCEIVFVTAYEEYAVQAFEQGAVDYVLKPAERERLQRTTERLRARLAQRHAGESSGAAGLQQLLQTLAARLDPARAPRLRWVQATVGSV